FTNYATSGSNAAGYRPIFSVTEHLNPLQSFAYNSADYKAETILERLRGYDIDRARCDALLKAEFAEDLPKPIATDNTQVSAKPELRRILQVTSSLRESYAPYINNVKPKQGTSTFVDDMKKFRACANYEGAIPECSEIEKLMKIAEK